MKTNLAIKVHKLNDGYFQVSYINPITQKRSRRRFVTERDAEGFKKETERKHYSGNLNHFADLPIGKMIERHLAECPQTRIMERKNMFTSFYDTFYKMKISELTRPILWDWFMKIKEEHDYSEKTLGSIRNQINHLFKYLVTEGIISTSPLDAIKFKRYVPPKRARIVLSVEEVLTILENAKQFSPDLLYPFLATVAHTGARREEIMRLTRTDVDFETGLIYLKRTKNGRDRFIRMTPALVDILKDHLASHTQTPVFSTDNGEYIITRKTIASKINKFKAYYPMAKQGWGCHCLRHSFASNFLQDGGEMYQLQAILGHRSIDVTIDTYGQLGAQDVNFKSPYDKKEKVV